MIDVSSIPIHSTAATTPLFSGLTDKNSCFTRILRIALPIIVSLLGFVFLSFEIGIALTAVVTLGAVFYPGEGVRQSSEKVEPVVPKTPENLRSAEKQKKTPSLTQSHKKNSKASPFPPVAPCLNIEASPNSTSLMTPRKMPKSRSSYTSSRKFLTLGAGQSPLTQSQKLPSTPHLSISQPPKTGHCLDDAELGSNSVKIVFASLAEKSAYDRRMELMIKRRFIEQAWIDPTTVVLTLTVPMKFIGVTPKHVINALKNPSLCLESQKLTFSLIDYAEEKNVVQQSNLNDPLDDAIVYDNCVNILFRTEEERQRYQEHIDYITKLDIVESTTEENNSITLSIQDPMSEWSEYLILEALRKPDFCSYIEKWSLQELTQGRDASTDSMANEMSRIIKERLVLSHPIFDKYKPSQVC